MPFCANVEGNLMNTYGSYKSPENTLYDYKKLK
jgi:hypothetical protein